MVVLGGLMAVTAILFSTLNVRVAGGMIAWRFGPGLIRFTLPLSQAERAAPTRLNVLAGIGIHFIGTGWVYNVSGRDAVEITKRGGGKLWIGTDEPERLVMAIERARAALVSAAATDR